MSTNSIATSMTLHPNKENIPPFCHLDESAFNQDKKGSSEKFDSKAPEATIQLTKESAEGLESEDLLTKFEGLRLDEEEKNEEEASCLICRAPCVKGVTLRPCLHNLCYACIQKHSNYSSQCPFCQKDVSSFKKNFISRRPIEENIKSSSHLQKPLKGSQEMHYDETISKGSTFVKGKEYIGFCLNGKKEGQGTMIYHDGSIYKGIWKNDKREGKGQLLDATGDFYEGDWMNDKFTGKGKGSLIDVGEYEGDWKDSLQDGYGTMKYCDGEIYEGDWKNGKREGRGTVVFQDGEKYEGDWMNDKKHGKGKHTWKDGYEYEGDWKDDLQDGYGTMKYCDGIIIYEGNWKNNKKEGKGTVICCKLGVKYEGDWMNNKMNGKGKCIRKDGSEFEVNFKYGVMVQDEDCF